MLTEDQMRELRELAVEEGKSMAELIRISVDLLLHSRIPLDPEEKRRRATSVIGQFKSGTPDLALEHDRYLEEAYGA
jgi:hypothetical protein